ncbi:MAG: glycosyltransferase family 39 protein [Chloroflexi bacterium]|nr:glycosyltransferase family 39 protein [Chloroflexota bacterium]
MIRTSALTLARSPLAALLGERGRLLRFAMTGGVAALTQLLLLELFAARGMPSLAANALAFLLAAQVNFWLSQLFTWRDRGDDLTAASVATRLARFHGGILGTAFLNMAVFAMTVTVLPQGLAAILGILAGAAGNYVLGDRFVFRAGRRRTPRQQVESWNAGAREMRAVIGARAGEGSMARAVAAPDQPPVVPPPSAVSAPADALPDAARSGRDPDAAARPDRSALWAGLGMAGVLLLAAVLYCWNLSRNGWGNEYYTAAALSGAVSRKAFFFGALDPGSFITVDKPPVGVWVQSLSVRLFGLSSWSVLLPQAMLALGTLLAVLTMTRRQFGGPAAILAGLVLALTPVTVAVARVNLPDSALILAMTLGAWATLVSIRRGQLRYLLLGVAMIGVGFNAKMLQAFVVAPAVFGTYLLTAPGGLLRRVWHLTLAGLMLLGVSASWMLVVDSIPAQSRPYIGGSSDNSVLELTLGYNGLGRVFGQGLARGSSTTEVVTRVVGRLLPTEADQSGTIGVATGPNGVTNGGPGGGPGGPGGGGPGFGGQPGILRLYNEQLGGQIGWLLPLAAAGLLAGLVATARRPRTDPARAWYLLWGGWLVTHAVVFSFASGILHPYYTSALGPSVAALAGPGVLALWQGYRRRWWLAPWLPLALAGTAAVCVLLVSRSTWLPWLAPGIVGAVALGGALLLLARVMRHAVGRSVALAGLTVALVGVLAGPAAWAVTPLNGSGMTANPQAGPQDSFGFGRGGPGGGPGGPPPGLAPPQGGPGPGGPGQVGMGPGFRQGRNGGANGPVDGPQDAAPRGGVPADGGFPGAGGPPGPGGPGGPGGRVSQPILQYLLANRGSAEYLVAVNSAMAASPIILETRLPVIAMGGFSGGDPAPTAAGLADLVSSGRLRFVMLGGRGGPGGGPGGPGGGNERTTWVQAHCSVVDPSVYGAAASEPSNGDGPVGRVGEQLYDCAPPAAAGG